MKSDTLEFIGILLAIIGFYALLNFVSPPTPCPYDYQTCQLDEYNARI